MTRRIPKDRVLDVARPALLSPGGDGQPRSMTVIPLVDGEEVAALEIRCRCGAHVVVDCVYDSEPAPVVAEEEAR